jgi:hypothetical protein
VKARADDPPAGEAPDNAELEHFAAALVRAALEGRPELLPPKLPAVPWSALDGWDALRMAFDENPQLALIPRRGSAYRDISGIVPVRTIVLEGVQSAADDLGSAQALHPSARARDVERMATRWAAGEWERAGGSRAPTAVILRLDILPVAEVHSFGNLFGQALLARDRVTLRSAATALRSAARAVTNRYLRAQLAELVVFTDTAVALLGEPAEAAPTALARGPVRTTARSLGPLL